LSARIKLQNKQNVITVSKFTHSSIQSTGSSLKSNTPMIYCNRLSYISVKRCIISRLFDSPALSKLTMSWKLFTSSGPSSKNSTVSSWFAKQISWTVQQLSTTLTIFAISNMSIYFSLLKRPFNVPNVRSIELRFCV